MLIKLGAQIDAMGPDDVTPLHDAAANGNQKVEWFSREGDRFKEGRLRLVTDM